MTDHAQLAKELFLKGYNCAQAVACAFCDITGCDIDSSARMASSFGGGLGRLRETCGVVSAAALVLGIVKGYDDPADRDAKKQHYALVREFAERFKAENASINCRELLTLAGLTPESGGEPEQRTEEFYRKRPCPRLVYDAARILDIRNHWMVDKVIAVFSGKRGGTLNTIRYARERKVPVETLAG